MVQGLTPRSSDDCGELEVDVLKVPHHGSAGFLDGFFEATGADWAVISADYDNAQHHHPRAVTIDALQDAGMEVLSTSTESTWDVVADRTHKRPFRFWS